MGIITTIYGDMDEALLEKKEGVINNEDEHTTWIEYRLGDEIVHRSVHVTLKKLPPLYGEAAKIG